ncbi:MAG: hypothetical protein MUO40_13975 [Anaerolineaceae bacterium]|nr:hypothetical protein [Anaerolineaceae bacterium]
MTKHFRDDYTYGDTPPETITSIFLIEKGWIDPMENHNADGYLPFAFIENEKKAKEFCTAFGFWTVKDCWSIQFHQFGLMSKYKYTKLPLLK